MLKEILIKSAINKLANKEKFQKARKLKKLKKKKHDKEMVEMFGKTRYALSYWFGIGVLFVGNTKEKIAEPLTQQPSNVIFLSDYRKQFSSSVH